MKIVLSMICWGSLLVAGFGFDESEIVFQSNPSNPVPYPESQTHSEVYHQDKKAVYHGTFLHESDHLNQNDRFLENGNQGYIYRSDAIIVESNPSNPVPYPESQTHSEVYHQNKKAVYHGTFSH